MNGEPVVEKGSKKRIVMIRDSSKRYFELDSLDPNTEYSFRLNAFNRNGDGEFSERKSIITQGIREFFVCGFSKLKLAKIVFSEQIKNSYKTKFSSRKKDKGICINPGYDRTRIKQ